MDLGSPELPVWSNVHIRSIETCAEETTIENSSSCNCCCSISTIQPHSKPPCSFSAKPLHPKISSLHKLWILQHYFAEHTNWFLMHQHNVNLVIAISPPSLGGSCTTAKKERNVDPKILNSKLCRWYCSSSLTNWCCRLWLLAKKSFDPLFTFPIAPSTKQPNSQRKSSSDDVVRFDQIMPTLPIAPSTKPLIS